MVSCIAGLFGICAGSNGTAKIRTLNVKKSFGVKMKVGEVIRIKLKKTQTEPIKFQSKNKRVATVNSKGYIKAKKTGNAKIVVKNSKTQIIGKIKVVKNNSRGVGAKSFVETEETDVKSEPFGVSVQMNTLVPARTPNIPQTSLNNDIKDNLSTLKPSDTPVTTISPVSDATMEPTSTPDLIVSPEPSPSPEVVGDLWLGFMIDQKEIYTNTTHLTGSMTPCRDCIMIISCGKDVIRTIKLDENKGTLDFDVDFSGYKAGTDVCIELKFVGEQEPPIYIWGTSQKLHYTLMEPGQTPAPSTPEPSLSPESTYEPRKAF
jgi:hypothetical protein